MGIVNTFKRIIFIVLLSPPLFASGINEEAFFDKQLQRVSAGVMQSSCEESTISCRQQSKLFVDALIKFYAGPEYSSERKHIELNMDLEPFELSEQVRLLDFFNKDILKFIGNLTVDELIKLNTRDLYNYCFLTKTKNCAEVIDFAKQAQIELPTKQAVKDLLAEGKTLGDNTQTSIIMLCRKTRNYPCRVALKNNQGQLVRRSDGTIWTLPTLGYSRHKLPYYKTNGNTPMGIFYVRGVMPDANKKKVFGQYRRMILNFVRESEGEVKLKSFLPPSSWEQNWWQESVVARNVGRGLFRIHGTGLKNLLPFSKHYPFVGTSGCVATREGWYPGHNYKDQRRFLNQLMQVQGLEVKYDNEPQIRAKLYIVNIDNKEGPVTQQDLEAFL